MPKGWDCLLCVCILNKSNVILMDIDIQLCKDKIQLNVAFDQDLYCYLKQLCAI